MLYKYLKDWIYPPPSGKWGFVGIPSRTKNDDNPGGDCWCVREANVTIYMFWFLMLIIISMTFCSRLVQWREQSTLLEGRLYFALAPLPVTMANEGLGWDPRASHHVILVVTIASWAEGQPKLSLKKPIMSGVHLVLLIRLSIREKSCPAAQHSLD